MSNSDHRPRLLIPALAPFYAIVERLSYPIIRVTAGLMLLPHGWPKLFGGLERFAEGLERRGFERAERHRGSMPDELVGAAARLTRERHAFENAGVGAEHGFVERQRRQALEGELAAGAAGAGASRSQPTASSVAMKSRAGNARMRVSLRTPGQRRKLT